MSSSVFQCPLCQATVDNQDELQLHYLTSCAGYDKVNNEQPRPSGGEVKLETSAIAGTTSERAPPSASGAGTASAAIARDTCTVQFMWQPLTEMSYPRITLLASFEPGSVELSLDSDGSYYASGHVTIPRGTYEGQLVIGDSFVHPVKEFTIEKDKDTVILQFQVTGGSGDDSTGYGGGQYGTGYGGGQYGTGYGGGQYGTGYMQRNPSYRHDDHAYQNYPTTSSGYNYDINDTYTYDGHGRGSGGSSSGQAGRRHQPADTLQPTNDFEYHPQYPAGYEPRGNEPGNSAVNQKPLQVSSDRAHPTVTQKTSHPSSDVYSQQLTSEGFGPASVRRKGGPTTTSLPDNTRPLSSDTIVTGTEFRSPSARVAGHSVAQSSELSSKAAPHTLSASEGGAPHLMNDINVPIQSKVGRDAFNVGELQQDMAMDYERQLLDLKEQLESVATERDTLLENRERVTAQWEGKTRRLEKQLEEYRRGQQPTEDATTAMFLEEKVSELEAEVETFKKQNERYKKQQSELKDQNAALKEQLSEYAGAISDQSKYIQGQYATSKAHDVELLQRQQEQIHLAEFLKKQQLEYAESLGSTQKRIAAAEKILEENIHLNQLNVNLTGELEDYQSQTKRLLVDLQHKEDEITQLRQQVYESGNSEDATTAMFLEEKVSELEAEVETFKKQNELYKKQQSELKDQNAALKEQLSEYAGAISDQSKSSRDRLELETMKQKCDAWREEVEKLAPFRDEVEQLRSHIGELEERLQHLSADNEGLAKQLQAVVDDGEMKQGEMGRKASEYDTFMERFMELQQVRATLENELGPLREERAGILRENAMLREGSQPEKYAILKQEYASLGEQCEHLQEALQHEKALVQRHLDAIVQIEQKLREATNPDKLQSIRERMERYRQERDQAQLQMEEVQKQAEEDGRQRISEERKAVNASEVRIAQLHSNLEELETRERTLQEESDEKMRCYRREGLGDYEHGYSPSIRPRSSNKFEQRKASSSSSTSSFSKIGLSSKPMLVDVKTKEGMRQMYIQKPVEPLNYRLRPRVVVKRINGEFCTGSLMYTGFLDGTDMAGVQLDISRSVSKLGNVNDGMFKDGKHHFRCERGYGLYAPLTNIYVEIVGITSTV